MKNFQFTIFSALLLMSMTGCVVEQLEEPVASVKLTAVMESGADTKTSLSGMEDGGYYPLWSAGDEIAVFVDEDKRPTKFTLSSGEGTVEASFDGMRSGSRYYALYPYDASASVSAGKISMKLPQTQRYTADSFGPNTFPMLGNGGSDGVMEFRNLCSVMKISVTGSAAIRSITLTANDEDMFLSGPAEVVMDYNSDVTDLLTMMAGGSNSVMLDCKGTVVSEDSPVDFHIVIPAGKYKGGFKIEIDAYTETVTKTIAQDISFERSQIRTVKGLDMDSDIPDIIPDAVPDNEIWYETETGVQATFTGNEFDAAIVSHTNVNGVWKIVFDKAVTKINYPSFSGVRDFIVGLYLPDTITEINSLQSAYGFGFKLTSFRIPENLKIFNASGCEVFDMEVTPVLTGAHVADDGRSIVIDDKLVAVSPGDMTEYTVPSGVRTVGTNAIRFRENTKIEKLVIPDGVEVIENEAFSCLSGAGSLKYVHLPSTLKGIGVYAFAWNEDIQAFYGDNEFVTADNKALVVSNYSYGLKALVAYASGSSATEYSVPEGVEAIAAYAFYHASALKKLHFPDSFVSVLSGHAFEGTMNIEYISGKNVLDDNRSLVIDGKLQFVATSGLDKYVTPVGVTALGDQVLNFKKDVKEIVISDEVESVDGYGYIFNGSPDVETVTISARMLGLGYDPFRNESWATPSMKTVYLRAPIPPVVYYNAPADYMGYDFDDLTIYVPEDSYDIYMSSQYWTHYREHLEPYDYGDLSEFYPDYYISDDYSQDGKVKTLQTATKGNGIDIVLMGDAYSDREIADGTYKEDMEFMYEKLFAEEPFKTYMNMFNVYYVNVVSMTEGYDHAGAALGGYFGDGTLVGGNDSKCFEYALNAISDVRMDEALVIVAMNSNAYAGTCYMYYPGGTGTYGSGPAVAYFPKGEDPETFAQLLHHEANGHGFAKLADEYAYEEMGAVPSDYVTEITDQQTNWGWWKNVDFTDDLTALRWKDFINDSRYAREGLGAFEGGLTYWSGVWRPTENSIMRYNYGGFNAPSREAIYYRIHKLAYGDSWEYDYEDFVEYDAVNRAALTAAGSHGANYVEKALEPTAPPVVVGRSWRE